ncbi:MAG: Bacterial transcription activator, effector binding domain [Candidatus Methanofastidiosum methylothiophilum]|uniref:Bacterial transcription activator, effector binding domain n=1 Tax=Candidatus Methanofastidiosum methylothiophilum TaxID=1705564 RepID=A0A150J143_9EURY|nr:MAG: Bacterial transcription activator, effector binding domain [Candidatus Methanofastidiosum methylthiophilus]KYC48163.1 MAG: Bacterial transcription activator, effector binding domain [Candidatus Methanofastidiosum methylthiophilus]KYC50818.1 MAG: Bacterial transcription activator, effector binding domain [Candidatus Methanofastidiosum methylthiophilus]
MEKIDFKKTMKNLYNPSSKEIALVDIPRMNFLTIQGKGNPNTSKDFQGAVEALYAVSYSIKMSSKKANTSNGYFEYVVPPLEGLWWISGEEFNLNEKDKFEWKIMIMQPEFINKEMAKSAIESTKKKKDNEMIEKIKFEQFKEGLSVQTMHVGSYDQEKETIERLKKYIKENGLIKNGLHHEIYLSDPRKKPPEALKTVLRQPVKKI